MPVLTLRATALLLLLGAPACRTRPACERPPPAIAGAVATVDARATEAGLAALRAGGNAIDAAVTAALTLGVVDPHNSGIGGGCFLLARLADGRVLCLDGREMAPRAATRDMYMRDGKAVPGLSLDGALAAGVPGSLMAYQRALRHAGRRSLAAALAPGIRLAERGAAVSDSLAKRLADQREALAACPGARAIFLDPQGGPWPVGHRLVQTDLAATYRAIARDGIGHLYGGPCAERIGAWMTLHGGVLTQEDFTRYRLAEREPLRTTYRGFELIGFPPPSSGGVHVAQILRMLLSEDLARMEREDPSRRLHLMAEVMKRAFADRAHWLGDPDFVAVPRGLCDQGYCDLRRGDIDLERALPVEGHGRPDGADERTFGKHTTHIAAADERGNWIAITTTINTSFGSKVVVAGTGVLLNNQMDDFSIRPGVPNAYGLIGAEANAIAPGKRPLSSMSPTILLRDGAPVLTIGAAGGPTIITQVVQAIVQHVDLGLPIARAVAAPRIHHQWRPDRVLAEEALPAATVAGLRRRGHDVLRRPTLGATQAIARGADGHLHPVSDPRILGPSSGRAATTRR